MQIHPETRKEFYYQDPVRGQCVQSAVLDVLIDSIISWQPVAIMAVNVMFLYLVAYANGWVYGTEKEGEQE